MGRMRRGVSWSSSPAGIDQGQTSLGRETVLDRDEGRRYPGQPECLLAPLYHLLISKGRKTYFLSIFIVLLCYFNL